jgi:anti-anti-sigma regulatory factor
LGRKIVQGERKINTNQYTVLTVVGRLDVQNAAVQRIVLTTTKTTYTT